MGAEAGNWYTFTAETAKGATGEALLWVLKREEEEANDVDDR